MTERPSEDKLRQLRQLAIFSPDLEPVRELFAEIDHLKAELAAVKDRATRALALQSTRIARLEERERAAFEAGREPADMKEPGTYRMVVTPAKYGTFADYEAAMPEAGKSGKEEE